MYTRFTRTAGWAAITNGCFGALGIILLMIFYTRGEPFGTLNDLTALPWSLALLILIYTSYRMGESLAKLWQRIGLITGLLGALAVFILQTLLVRRVITIWQETPLITAAYGLVGIWMMTFGRYTLRGGIPPRSVGLLSIVIGAGWVLANVLVWIGGLPPQGSMSGMADMENLNPLTLTGFILTLLAYFAQTGWALWLGRTLLARKTAYATLSNGGFHEIRS